MSVATHDLVELLTAMPPGLRDALLAESQRRMVDAAGQGAVDQFLAAAKESDSLSRQLISAVQERHGGQYGEGRMFDLPENVRLTAFETWALFVAGKGSTCMHSPVPMRPQPLYGAAWRPGLLVCGPCAATLFPRKGSLADMTCDGCGRDVRETGESLVTGALPIASASIFFGLCPGCAPAPPAS